MRNTDPIKVEIVEPSRGSGGDDDPDGLIMAGGGCLTSAGLIWWYIEQGFFDSMVGRLVFIPALIAVFLLGYRLAFFLFGSCLGLLALVVIGLALFALYMWIVGEL